MMDAVLSSVTPAVLEKLKKQQTYTLPSLMKCRNKLASLMTNADNLHLVKDAVENLNILYQAYEDAHTDRKSFQLNYVVQLDYCSQIALRFA